MSKQWINSKGEYYYNDIPVVTDKLPKGVYELNFDGFSGEFFLTYVSDSFGLPEKVYGIEKGLTERIITTFKRLDKNFGVLLKGLKGTGKTVTAKTVCNRLELPVILVNKAFSNMGGFINSIQQDVIIMFDEFEKTYSLYGGDDDDDDPVSSGDTKRGVNQLLTLMDGVFTSDYKRLFLLTTNKVFLPDAMLSRPSRIRYIKEFNDLDFEGIHEVLTDLVEDKKLIPGLVEILKELDVITVDIVKSIAEETNIYGTADKEFFSIFNVSRDSERYDLIEFTKEGEKVLAESVDINLEHYYPTGSINIKKAGIYAIVEEMDLEQMTLTVRDRLDGKTKRKLGLRKSKFIHESMVNAYF